MSAWDAPCRKRRRLVSKARDPFAGDDEPPAAQPNPEDDANEHDGIALPANTDAWAQKNTREKRMFIGNRLRRMNWYEKFKTALNKQKIVPVAIQVVGPR